VVTDLAMPGMNGLDLIRAIRQRGLDLPAILLTGHAEEGMPLALEGAVTRNFSLVRKPVSGPDLAARLAALIAAAAGTPRAPWLGPLPEARPEHRKAGAACATPAPNSAEIRTQRE
jgi:DNA-binding response OmpR family regulator